MLAARTCPAILAGADMSRASSISPTKKIAAAARTTPSGSDEPANVALERILSRDGRPALVFDGAGRLAGVVSLIDLERAAAYAIGGSTEG
jgi:hypothetical protein